MEKFTGCQRVVTRYKYSETMEYFRISKLTWFIILLLNPTRIQLTRTVDEFSQSKGAIDRNSRTFSYHSAICKFVF